MSLHLMYDHQCEKCEANYIPYDTNIACPSCGLYEEPIALGLVSTLAQSAHFQKEYFGSYIPHSWWSSSLGDYSALLIFKVLDIFHAQNEKSFQEVSLDYFSNRKWNGQEYMITHIYELSCRVYFEIENTKKTNWQLFLIRIDRIKRTFFKSA